MLLDQVCNALAHNSAGRAVRSEREHPRQRFESASDLLLSQRTIELYRARVMEKTGSASLAQRVRMAIELRVEPRPH
jgi:hypothetical protein